MPFDPNEPALNSPNSSAVMREQLNSLKALVDAVLTSAVIDEVVTLDPGSPATASASLVDGVLHLSFGIPTGPQGDQGPEGTAGSNGGPGEVTFASLNEALAGTARNPVGLTTLDTAFADPDAESLRQAYNLLLGTLFRAPI